MKPTQGGESKNFVALRRGQGALRAHLYPRRLLDEHNVWSIYPPLSKEGEIRGDRLLDVMTPEGKSLGWGITYTPFPMVSAACAPPGRTCRSGSAMSTSSMKAGWCAGCEPGDGSKWTEAWPEPPAPGVCWACCPWNTKVDPCAPAGRVAPGCLAWASFAEGSSLFG